MYNKSTKTEIKEHISQSNLKYLEIIDRLNNYGISTTQNAFTNKLNRDTVRYSEVKALADILECELTWIPKTQIDKNILFELKRNNMDINLFEGFISNIFALADPLNNGKNNSLMTLTLMLSNQSLNKSLTDMFEYLNNNYR